MADFDLEIRRGDDRVIVVTATYPEAIPDQDVEQGDPYPLTGKDMWVTGKLGLLDDDAEAVFQKTNGAGITVRGSPEEHIAEVRLIAADTADLPGSETHLVCDAQVKTEDNEIWTIAFGTLTVLPDVTQAI